MASQEPKIELILEIEEVGFKIPSEEPNFPTAAPETNPISDAVSHTDVAVVGEAPATAETGFSQSLSLATSLTAQNAVNVQKQLTMTHQANTNKELKHFLFPKLRGRHNKAYAESLKTLTGIMTRFESMQK